MQEQMICQFCEMQGIDLTNIFVDVDNDTGGKLRWLPSSDNQPLYMEGKLLKSWIQEGKIDCIYVDSEIRLKVAYFYSDDFWKLCHDKDIRIIEIFLDDKISESKDLQRTVVYHFTDGSEKRPCIVEKDIDSIYKYLDSHKNWNPVALYLDKTLVKTNQMQYQQLRKRFDRYDILLTKDFYHIQTKTVTFWKHIQQLLSERICIHSVIDGNLDYFYDPQWLLKDLKVAIYYRSSEAAGASDLRAETLNMFVSMKTQWNVQKVYADQRTKYSDKQTELESLLLEASQYDLILVDSFVSIHFRTAKLMKTKKKLNKPIYSMKEGGILL